MTTSASATVGAPASMSDPVVQQVEPGGTLLSVLREQLHLAPL